ncbi:hypothetical protein H8N00_06910 [Streptomyces sp. AC563]|uniref:hypothetical protein n=1 Tax=Streptomyces buecherae TaxID=2763006 RepID=UPI00164DB689|nr:hypothetical protein [Streptomyces buecherae]
MRWSTSRSRIERVVVATAASATAIAGSSHSRIRTRAVIRRPGAGGASAVVTGSVVARVVVLGGVASGGALGSGPGVPDSSSTLKGASGESGLSVSR